MVKNDDFVAKIRVDTAENELRKESCVVESLWLWAEQARRKETKGIAEHRAPHPGNSQVQTSSRRQISIRRNRFEVVNWGIDRVVIWIEN